MRKMKTTLLAFVIAAGAQLSAQPTAHAAPAPSSCATLNGPSLSGLLGILDAAVASAQTDFKANGVVGAYAVAAKYNLDYVTTAQKKVRDLQNWMISTGYDATNASTAYQIHSYMNEAITSLQAASHWALISTVYHKSTDARSSFEGEMKGTEVANQIGTQAGRCYMVQYLP
jgi:hypothetical protein